MTVNSFLLIMNRVTLILTEYQHSTMDEIINKLNTYFHHFLGLLPRLVMAVLILVIGILISNFIATTFRKRIKVKSEDPLMSKFLAKTVKLVLIIISFMLALNIAGLGNLQVQLWLQRELLR